MEELSIPWQLVSVIGGFCGVIAAMVTWYGTRIHVLLDKLVDTTNSHTTEITVERHRNNNQDDRLDEHDEKHKVTEKELESIKERVWEVRYRRA